MNAFGFLLSNSPDKTPDTHYKTQMPFPELLTDIGQQQRDLSIAELAEFVDAHLNGHAYAAAATGWPL
jgi:hypothetical protein